MKSFIFNLLLFFTFSLISQPFEGYLIKVRDTEKSKKAIGFKEFIKSKNVKGVQEILFKQRKKSSSSSLFFFRAKLSALELVALKQISEIISVEKEPKVSVLYRPNDPYSDINLNGSEGQSTLKTHNFYDAWDIEQGDTNVLVGVVDTGVWFEHRDIKGQVMSNVADPINGINDDSDSLIGLPLIDNYQGWDVADWDNDPSINGSPHGLEVSGIISAAADNDLNIAGLSPGLRLLPVKACPDDNPYAITHGYQGLLFAAEQGARVVNLSWGADSYPGTMFQELIDYVVNDLDVVVVCAAGNSRIEETYYPAGFDGVISVTGINIDSSKQGLSTFDYSVDMCAVGWQSTTLSSVNDSAVKRVSGTSYAAPVVAAVAGLVASYKPDFNAKQIIKQLEITSVMVDTMASNQEFRWKMGRMVDPVQALSKFNHPGYTVLDGEILDTLKLGKPGQLVSVDVLLTNVFESASNVMVSVSNFENIFEASSSEVSIDSGRTKKLQLVNTFLETDTLNHGLFNFLIEYKSDGYYDYEVVQIPYLTYECTDSFTEEYQAVFDTLGSKLSFIGLKTDEARLSFDSPFGQDTVSLMFTVNGQFSHQFESSGVYDNLWLHLDSCSFTLDTSFSVQVLTSLSVFNPVYKISPNPTSGMVNITGPEDDFELVVFDLMGNKLATQKNRNQFNLVEFPVGAYLVRVITAKESYSFKLIKN